MIKKINFLFLFASISMLSQSNSNFDISGAYKLPNANPEGGQTVVIYKDGNFATFFFGGALKGTWKLIGNTIHFDINKKPDFALYGRNKESIKDSTHIEFMGFSQNPTFLNFNRTDQREFLRIFNENANCYSFPYIHKTKKKIHKIDFAQHINRQKKFEVYSFEVPDNYNDLVAINLSATYTQDYNFTAEFKNKTLFFEGNAKPAKKLPIPTGEDAVFIKELINQEFFPKTLTSEEEFFPIYDHPTEENSLPFSRIYVTKIHKALIDVLSQHLFTANCD